MSFRSIDSFIQKLALIDLHYRDEIMTVLYESFPEKTIMFHLANVSDKADLERAFKEVMYKFHAIDLVIGCAGVLNEANYQLTLEVNLVRLCTF